MFGSYLEGEFWNNALSFFERKKIWSKLKLFVPEISEITDFTNEKLLKNLKIWDRLVFEEVEKWKLLSKKWLDKYLVFEINWTKFAIFDNHNIALYFLWMNYFKTWRKLDLIHIDQHSDMWEPNFIPENILNEQELIDYTFKWTNVWNYLIPAKKFFINEIFQKRTEVSVLELKQSDVAWKILNIDLDFWTPEMATTEASLYHIKRLMFDAELVLFATSPYFLDQRLAIKLLEKIFYL